MRVALAQGVVASGDLVMPFPKLRMPAGYRRVLVVNPARARLAHVEAFRAWLLQQFRRPPQLAD